MSTSSAESSIEVAEGGSSGRCESDLREGIWLLFRAANAVKKLVIRRAIVWDAAPRCFTLLLRTHPLWDRVLPTLSLEGSY